MKSDVREAIRKYYPEGRYDKRRALPTNSAGEQRIKRLARQIGGRESEIDVEKPGEFELAWQLLIYLPSRREVRVQVWSRARMKRVKNSGKRYMCLLWVSELGPFANLYWNTFEIRNGRFQSQLVRSPRRRDLRDLEGSLVGLLEAEGIRRLTKEELDEKVPWVEKGDSLIERVPTVWNCLFSEA